ncbi:MurR/RpiR family transcriptional regulator [Nonomuraea sp. NPDC049709]|uniref:MurR/RpiR family transcriptional regulator n=1 Tax=Nonomuraea sp. NPDC049709 TaxID=3154736 RepID=UPI00341F6A76
MENDPIAARLGAAYPDLPPGERAVVRVLLDDYPFAALGSLRSLAERAGVSPPTASRLFDRLGYGGFAAFQTAVRDGARDRSRLLEFVTRSTPAPATSPPGSVPGAELSTAPASDGPPDDRGPGRHEAPETGSPNGRDAGQGEAAGDGSPFRSDAHRGGSAAGGPSGGGRVEGTPAHPVADSGATGAGAVSVLWQAAEELRAGLDGTLAAIPESLCHKVAELLAGARAVWALGGPLSELAAEYLIRQLASLRPAAHRVPGSAPGRARTVLDLGASDVVVAYDFRRYSPDTARFVHAARARGARLVLVTDAWGSPLAAEAEVLIRLPREAAGPIAPLANEIAVTELLLVATAARLDPVRRLADLDALTQTL